MPEAVSVSTCRSAVGTAAGTRLLITLVHELRRRSAALAGAAVVEVPGS
ncbi:hypothetical protein [Amycolatopsis sp.]|nr:hypothetical protein [Amycolatopsis sp.]HVV12682.1 hypothetical protein [Amycolatopsis sp.]